jgi:hypothetical protein
MYGKDASGVSRPVLIDSDRKLVTAPTGGKHVEAAMAGRLFYAANQTNVIACATLNDTFTGLAIVNPLTSGKNLIMHEFNYAVMDSPDVDSNLSLAEGDADDGYAADIAVRCTRFGYRSSVTIADASATRTGHTTVIVKHVGVLGTNITTDLMQGPLVIDLHGSIILAPGRAICTDSLLQTNSVMVFGFMWEEVDV